MFPEKWQFFSHVIVAANERYMIQNWKKQIGESVIQKTDFSKGRAANCNDYRLIVSVFFGYANPSSGFHADRVFWKIKAETVRAFEIGISFRPFFHDGAISTIRYHRDELEDWFTLGFVGSKVPGIKFHRAM